MISLADLHCDTLFECFTRGTDLSDSGLHINLEYQQCFENFIQTYAHFIPEKTEDKWSYLNTFITNSLDLLAVANIPVFKCSEDLKNRNLAVLSVEGGDIFDDKECIPLRALQLKEWGINFFSLIYNQTNSLGCGAHSKDDFGLTELGREVLFYLEQQNIMVDVSHASLKSTEDILQISQKPVCATHSNAFALTPNARNLNDLHLKKIAESGGLIGLNLYPPFLSLQSCDVFDIMQHIKHMVNLCGERHIVFGCDFDGVDQLPKGINNVSSMEKLYSIMKKNGFNTRILDQIFFTNTYDFLNANFRR